MPSVVYKSLTDLVPIEPQYHYYTNEPLNLIYKGYLNGLTQYSVAGTQLYQDVVFNKNSCMILTSAVNLNTIFKAETPSTNPIPQTILLQPRNSTIYYIKHDTNTNTFRLTLTSASTFFIQPLDNSKFVRLYVDSKPLQVQSFYPYEVYLSNETIDEQEKIKQQFEMVLHEGLITFKTLTDSGYRYLCLNNDNILRAVGLIFNESIINDYVFKAVPITNTPTTHGFIPTNNWVTYYLDIETKENNRTTTVNKDFKDTNTNFLIDFPYIKATKEGIANLNIANLKTGVTPTGGPAPINNSYTKQVTTTN
jgi:hypothetical protein